MSRRLIAMIFSLICFGCNHQDNEKENKILGTWTATFETIWSSGGMWDPPIINSDTIAHTSTMSFRNDLFTINIAPPVYAGYLGVRLGTSRSQWFGTYELNDDTLHFIVDDSTGDQLYIFSIIDNDMLELNILREENPFDSLVYWYPSGGIPWGNNYLHSNGTFSRIED